MIRALAAMCLLLATTTAVVSAQEAPKGVKIGVMNDQSGVYSGSAGVGSVVAARLAIEDAKSFMKGVPVELVVADHQNKPDVGLTIARKWYDVDGVDAIFDLSNSAISLGVQALTRDSNRGLVFNVGSGTEELIGKQCSPRGALWIYDTYSFVQGLTQATSASGADTWFLIVADYALGKASENAFRAFLPKSGGSVVGRVYHPVGTLDFSSFMLQAQASKAKVVGIASATGDLTNLLKSASEFQIASSGQKLSTLFMFIQDVHAIGLERAQGMQFLTSFYWDMSEETRQFAKRYAAQMNGSMPGQVHAGVYSAITHYLKAVAALNDKAPDVVMQKMRDTPVNDFYTRNARLRNDGRVVRDFYLVEVKSPSESKYPWDYYKMLRTVAGNEVGRPIAESECPLVK